MGLDALQEGAVTAPAAFWALQGIRHEPHRAANLRGISEGGRLRPPKLRFQARVSFVQTVADLATRPQNIDVLQNAGVMALLRRLWS